MDIPHLKQSQETSCGAAALAMVYSYLGLKEETESTVWERIRCKRPNTEGEYYIQTNSIGEDGRKHGFSFFIGNACLNSVETALQPLKEFLAASVPVIVCQRVSESNEWGHFRVVTSINADGSINLNDPMKDVPETMDTDRFMELWQRSEKTEEVVGGQFIAIFNKVSIGKDKKFLVTNFFSSVESFAVSEMTFLE